eukprot:4546631-Pleurochrysis_carterae.AAC.1
MEETTWVRSGGINSASNRDQKKSCDNAGREKKLTGANKQNQASVSERGKPKLRETKRGQGRVTVGARKGVSVDKNERQ